METIVALVGFSLISAGTPGPNNVLLWASGAEFGLRATLRHVLGTAVGIGTMAVIVAAGLGAVFTVVPEVATVMKVGASIYLLYLAYQVAGARAAARGTLVRPLGLVQAAGFQAVNPKAWVFAVGAISTFRPAGYPVLAGGIVVALIMTAVVIPTAAAWAAAGGAISRLMTSGTSRRLVSGALALVLAATVIFVWV